jgi:hypothetical protein
VLPGIFGQLADQHDGHSFGVIGQRQLSLLVVDVSVLVELVELKVVALDLLDCIDVGVDHVLAVLDEFVLEEEVDEPVA